MLCIPHLYQSGCVDPVGREWRVLSTKVLGGVLLHTSLSVRLCQFAWIGERVEGIVHPKRTGVCFAACIFISKIMFLLCESLAQCRTCCELQATLWACCTVQLDGSVHDIVNF